MTTPPSPWRRACHISTGTPRPPAAPSKTPATIATASAPTPRIVDPANARRLGIRRLGIRSFGIGSLANVPVRPVSVAA